MIDCSTDSPESLEEYLMSSDTKIFLIGLFLVVDTGTMPCSIFFPTAGVLTRGWGFFTSDSGEAVVLLSDTASLET